MEAMSCDLIIKTDAISNIQNPGTIRELQDQSRRQYHIHTYELKESVVQDIAMDISSATDDCNHNHHIQNEDDHIIDSDEEDALLDNYIYRAQQRKRKQCSDWEQYTLQ